MKLFHLNYQRIKERKVTNGGSNKTLKLKALSIFMTRDEGGRLMLVVRDRLSR